jgi:hypothetical protein
LFIYSYGRLSTAVTTAAATTTVAAATTTATTASAAPITATLVAAATTTVTITATPATWRCGSALTRFLFTGSASSGSLLSRVSIGSDELFSSLLTKYLSNRLATARSLNFGRAQFTQSFQAGMNGIPLIGTSKCLGQDIAHAYWFHNGTHCPTGNNASARRRRLEHDFRGAKVGSHHKGYSWPGKRYLDQVLLGIFYPFANSFGIFAGLPKAATDIAIVITNNHQCPNAKAPAAFDHLWDAAHLYNRFFQV